VVTTIPVRGTAGIAITPDGTQAYVTSPGAGTDSVINTATNTVGATISLGTNRNPFGVAITPDGTRAYVTNDDSDSVSVIDTTTSTVVATIPVGAGPVAVAITPMSPTPTDKEQCKDHRIFEVRSACRTLQERRAMRQLRRASFDVIDEIHSATLRRLFARQAKGYRKLVLWRFNTNHHNPRFLGTGGPRHIQLGVKIRW
jgi:YVTN family beta-propeller protein